MADVFDSNTRDRSFTTAQGKAPVRRNGPGLAFWIIPMAAFGAAFWFVVIAYLIGAF